MLEIARPQEQYALRVGGAELTRLHCEDADELWALIQAERVHLDRWTPAAEATHEEVRATLERADRAWHTGFQFRFVLRRAGRIVGMCGFVDVFADPGVGELGYWLARGASGFGLATESVRVLTHAAFTELGLQKAEVSTAMGNLPSRRLAERLGFTLEGVRRRCERIASGDLVDHAIYGMLVEEWPAP